MAITVYLRATAGLFVAANTFPIGSRLFTPNAHNGLDADLAFNPANNYNVAMAQMILLPAGHGMLAAPAGFTIYYWPGRREQPFPGTHQLIDDVAIEMRQSLPSLLKALGTAETNLNPNIHTMRAHHVSDSVIRRLTARFLNRDISLAGFLSAIGLLYQTSWIDVFVTPRLFIIWCQWVQSMWITVNRILAGRSNVGVDIQRAEQLAVNATILYRHLTSSIGNFRIGHQATDNRIADSIAPHISRSGLLGMISSFIRMQNPNFHFLSFETTMVRAILGPQVDLPIVGGNQIYISEEIPTGRNVYATVQLPHPHPLASNTIARTVTRVARSSLHLAAPLATPYIMHRFGMDWIPIISTHALSVAPIVVRYMSRTLQLDQRAIYILFVLLIILMLYLG